MGPRTRRTGNTRHFGEAPRGMRRGDRRRTRGTPGDPRGPGRRRTNRSSATSKSGRRALLEEETYFTGVEL
ncbi:hypothetical protein N9M16_05435 [Candidatus Dependentiae bacterium]|nr:hypothetical protein [Candidatus Dependentiae bacterium]